jgi:hypothetical protein
MVMTGFAIHRPSWQYPFIFPSRSARRSGVRPGPAALATVPVLVLQNPTNDTIAGEA